MKLLNNVQHWIQRGVNVLDWMSPASDLLIRLWIANIFWKAGTSKLASWDSTLYLFEYEYAVPFLSPELAAYLGTGVELGMPVLLALGLATRFSALVLFVFNIIAVISYPTLNEIGIKDFATHSAFVGTCCARDIESAVFGVACGWPAAVAHVEAGPSRDDGGGAPDRSGD